MGVFTHRGSGSMSQRSTTAVVVALVVVLAGCAGLGVGGGQNESMPFMNHTATDGVYTGSDGDGNATTNITAEGDANLTLYESGRVTVENQTTNGTVVTVHSITVPEGGYAVIHDARRMDAGLARNIIGVSAYLDPGTHRNVTVTLFDVPGYDFGEDAHLMGDVRVFVTPHHETTANRTFEYVTSDTAEDGPYRNETGAVPVAFGTVSVEHEQE